MRHREQKDMLENKPRTKRKQRKTKWRKDSAIKMSNSWKVCHVENNCRTIIYWRICSLSSQTLTHQSLNFLFFSLSCRCSCSEMSYIQDTKRWRQRLTKLPSGRPGQLGHCRASHFSHSPDRQGSRLCGKVPRASKIGVAYPKGKLGLEFCRTLWRVNFMTYLHF